MDAFEQEAAPCRGRDGGAQDLAVQRVRQPHLLTAADRSHVDEPCSLELLDRVGTGRRLEDTESDRLPERDPLEGGLRVGVGLVQSGRDRVGQAGRRFEPAHDAPDATVAPQPVAVDGAEDELTCVQDVALARGPHRVDCVCGDRAAERGFEDSSSCARESTSRSTRRISSWRQRSAMFLDTGSLSRTVPTRKFSPRVEELAQQRRRRRVQQLHVVEEQHHPAALAASLDRGRHLREQGDRIAPVQQDAGGE